MCVEGTFEAHLRAHEGESLGAAQPKVKNKIELTTCKCEATEACESVKRL
jgi:hypothetical protein